MSQYVPEWKRLGIEPSVKNSLIENKEITTQGKENNINVNIDNSKININNIDKNYNYYLLLRNEILSCGTKDNIKQEVQLLIYGEHPKFPGIEIDQNDILVLKKIPLKIGVFLDE